MGKMSDAQRRLRRWFQRHGWHTNNTQTNRGVNLEMPVQKGANYVSWPYRKDGTLIPEEEQYHWHIEYLPHLRIEGDYQGDYPELDSDTLEIAVYKREVYTKGPDFEKKNKPWPHQPETYITISYEELKKIMEMMNVCKEDYGKK